MTVAGSVTSDRGTVDAEDPVTVTIGEITGGMDVVTNSFQMRVDSPIAAGVDGLAVSNQATVDLLSDNGPDASNHLARQLIATQLNLLVGSDPTILPVVDDADAFLEVFPPGSDPQGADRQQADAIKDQLDAYNNPDCVQTPVDPG